MRKLYTIIDLDNCIADDGWRIRHIDWSPGVKPFVKYHRYHSLSGFDNVGNRWLYDDAVQRGAVIVFTGRPVIYRELTLEWIRRNFQEVPEILIMRNNDDHRPAVELKTSMLRCLWHYSVEPDQIYAAYDDHADIVAMYAAAGLHAFRKAIHDLSAYEAPRNKEHAT